MVKKIYFIIIVLLATLKISAQTCTVIVNSNLVCLGSAINFSATFTPGLTPSIYEWNFGNGVTNNQASPTYNYPNTGNFTPTLKITFTNNSQCMVNGSNIQVVALPIADFSITTATRQCFKGNNVCVNDLSKPGPSGSPLNIRTFLWGDGGFDVSPISNKNFCNTYTNSAGSTNLLVLEVTDANGCLTRLEKNNSIVILPKPDAISFVTQYSLKCNTTPVTFLNTSILAQSKVKKFTWDFGDGSIDSSSTKWNNFIHNYTIGGYFSPRLIVTDLNDCKDTFVLVNGAQNLKLDDKITITNVDKCFSKQDYSFSVPGSSGANIYWSIYDNKGKIFDTIYNTAYIQLANKKFNCGWYKVNMYASAGGCNIKADTLVEVFGPNTILANDTVRPINENQCIPNDTVFFRVPPPEISCFYKNVTNWLWDFGDGFAPPCTTDTKNGINVGVNCRYSKDSTNIKHKYNPTKPDCYNVKLLITDPIKNCSDLDSSLVILSSPNAKPNLPTRRGLYYYTIPPGEAGPPLNCFTSTFVFQYEETLPDCGRERVWINLDSAAGKNRWDSVYPKENFHITRYSNTANPNGWVTVGLIIKNSICYDTAWYHNMFQLLKIKPQFKAKVEGKCPPYKVTVNLIDSIQDSIVTAEISFNGIDSIQNLALTDSVINQKVGYFNSMGIKTIRVTLTNTKGCSQVYDTILYLGFYKDLAIPKPIGCFKDSIQFLEVIDYYSRTTNYWKQPARAIANKEKLWWNFGDTNLYVAGGSSPKYKFSRPGNFLVKIAIQDSLGCRDTMVARQTVKIVDVKANILPISANLICAPKIIPFKDNSKVIDSSALYGNSSYDNIISWSWDFGDLKAKSFLKDPLHDYTSNDSFMVTHIVKTTAGCTDTVFLPLIIKGPKPKYIFSSGDTLGCAPVKLKINNTTGKQIKSWQWTVNGPLNFIISTDKDTATDFSLVKAGKYRILLLGTDSLVNEVTGQTVYCTSVYPDTLNPSQKPVYVTVYDKPLVNLIGPDTVCPNQNFSIIGRADTIYNQFLWKVSDGFTATLKPKTDTIFTHSIKDTGNFIITMIPSTSVKISCLDTGYHAIYVSNIKANFDIDDTKSPLYSFTNKSTNAVSYNWNFGQPNSGAENSSNIQNPSHDYKNLNDSFRICLVVKNAGDCYDTACKVILPIARLINVPNVFTPNNDGINDAFDIDIFGEFDYNLKIFNRWGGKVFDGTKDGKGNDGINWNGKTDNDGSPNPDGVYYYTFKYKFNSIEPERTLHGSITLIRE